MKRLSELKLGEKGKIKQFLDKDLSVKMLEMGCLPGTEVSVNLIAPFGDPIAITVADYCLSIRKEDANLIVLED